MENEQNEQNEQNQKIKIGKIVYHQIKQNPDTGWINLKNENGTAFWIPNELLDEVNYLNTLREEYIKSNIKVLDLRNKIDNHRRSADYFKNDRNYYKQLNNNANDIIREKTDKYKLLKEESDKQLADAMDYQTAIINSKRLVENELKECSRLLTLQKVATHGALILAMALFVTLIVMVAK
jgi:hypothetical protein